jgi:hypothetical protein
MAAGSEPACANVGNEQVRHETEQRRQESNTNPVTGQPYSTGLPDCRAYEMVSPLYKQGANATLTTAGIPVAPNGETAGFQSEGAFSNPENSLGGLQDINYYTSQRGASGWITVSAFAPAKLVAKPSFPGLSSDFSPDLRSAQVGCGPEYLAKPEGTLMSVVCAARTPSGWVATKPYRSTQPGLANEEQHVVENVAGYLGGSSDLSRVFFQPERSVLPGDSLEKGAAGIYEISGMGTPSPQLRLVNVEGPNGSEKELQLPEGSLGGAGPLLGDRHGTSQNPAGTDYQAISESGETVFFTATPEGGAQTLYARIPCTSGPSCAYVEKEGQKVEGRETLALSVPSPNEAECHKVCKESTAANAVFQGASADGKKVFFTTTQQLLDKDENTETVLYEYEFSPSGNKLKLISGGQPGQNVEGVVRTSSDGGHVYFVARGPVLTSEKRESEEPCVPVGECVGAEAREASSKEPNLYGYDTTTGSTKFVAANTTTKSFNELHGEKTVSKDIARRAQVSRDGGYLVFSTAGKLAGDTNCPMALAVYRYAFQTGALEWVSHAAPGYSPSKESCPAGEGKDAFIAPLPGTKDGAEADINDWARAISDNGEFIIFTTAEKLQATDENGALDVYEWHNGTVSMISDGYSPEGVTPSTASQVEPVAAMSASGSDIFFFTHARLVGQDTDVLDDVYDARIAGGYPKPAAEPTCSGEACQGPATPPPSFGAAVSSVFAATGNPISPLISVAPSMESKPKPPTRAQLLAKALKACKKKPKKQRGACESQAKRKYGAKAKPKKRGRSGK